MKKLFCVVVTDPNGDNGLESPIIFLIKCEEQSNSEEAVKGMLEEEYGYEPEWIENFDIFSFEVTDEDIIEL